jgi:2-methylcitrate dehydratase PrpD
MRRQRSELVSDKVARFVVRLCATDLSQTVKEAAKEHLLDGFATMLGGAQQDASRHIDSYLQNVPAKAESTVIGFNRKLIAQYAALANGIRGHVLDYDDA